MTDLVGHTGQLAAVMTTQALDIDMQFGWVGITDCCQVLTCNWVGGY